MRDFISGNELNDAELIEFVEHGIVQRADGSIWQTWRIDADGMPWLRSLDSIRASAIATDYDVYPDIPDDLDDDGSDVEMTWIYEDDDDE